MKVLVACEESQAVTVELRKLGHEAYSCDIIPCSGGHPEWHIKQDVLPLLNGFCSFRTQNMAEDDEPIWLLQKWDMIIAFPPCTYLTVTGNRWFNVERYGEKAIQRQKDREDAIWFFMQFANADCPKIAIENPVGIISSTWRKPNQIINPYEFGDPFEKKTCLWLKGLPELKPTNIVEVPPRKQFDSGRTMPAWYAEAWHLPKEERAKMRSKTFPGIAKAMAEQWGNERKLKVLELFAGTRSIGKAFEARGHEVFSVEWDKRFDNIDLYADVLTVTAAQIIEKFGKPDVIWASPDCTTYSVAAISKHRRKEANGNLAPITEYAKFCDTVNAHVVNLIRELNPRFWFIENPVGGLRKMDFMKDLPRHTVTYCQYGERRQKPTDIWTNHPSPEFKPACKRGMNCHDAAPRGSKTGTQALKNAVEKARIPVLLCEHIVDICERGESIEHP